MPSLFRFLRTLLLFLALLISSTLTTSTSTNPQTPAAALALAAATKRIPPTLPSVATCRHLVRGTVHTITLTLPDKAGWEGLCTTRVARVLQRRCEQQGINTISFEKPRYRHGVCVQELIVEEPGGFGAVSKGDFGCFLSAVRCMRKRAEAPRSCL